MFTKRQNKIERTCDFLIATWTSTSISTWTTATETNVDSDCGAATQTDAENYKKHTRFIAR